MIAWLPLLLPSLQTTHLRKLTSLTPPHPALLSHFCSLHSQLFVSDPLLDLSLRQHILSLQPADYQFSVTHYLLLAPVFLLPPRHLWLCLSSLYIHSLCFLFSPSPAAWIYYYQHNRALLIVYELPALRPNKAYFHEKPPFHFSSN